MKRLELSTILCLTFVSIVLGWPERMLAQRSGHAGSFHSGGFYGRGSHPAFQGVHAYGNYRSAGYDGGHGNYYGWRAAYGGYYPHYRYGYGWGFRIGFGFGPYWYYGFPYGYGPWWGPLYPYTYSNYYPYYVPPGCPYPYQRSSKPPPANPAPNSDGDSSPQHFTTPAPENPPSNSYLTDAADPSSLCVARPMEQQAQRPTASLHLRPPQNFHRHVLKHRKPFELCGRCHPMRAGEKSTMVAIVTSRLRSGGS